jgi:hypothetical protein
MILEINSNYFPQQHYVVGLYNVVYSVEIPTRYSFVIEFIIPKFTEGST